MDNNDILKVVTEVVTNQLSIGYDEDIITTPLVEYGLDSLDMTEIILALEEEFNINISEEEFPISVTDLTIENLNDFISKKVLM